MLVVSLMIPHKVTPTRRPLKQRAGQVKTPSRVISPRLKRDVTSLVARLLYSSRRPLMETRLQFARHHNDENDDQHTSLLSAEHRLSTGSHQINPNQVHTLRGRSCFDASASESGMLCVEGSSIGEFLVSHTFVATAVYSQSVPGMHPPTNLHL